MNGFFKIYETADAKTKPLDSIAAILVKLNFFERSTIWLIVSVNAFTKEQHIP